MIVIFISTTPYSCQLYSLAKSEHLSTLRSAATLHFLDEGPLRLPWRLRNIIGEAPEGEKIVVHTSSPYGVAAAEEGARMAHRELPYIVYMPVVTDDDRDLKRLGKYAANASYLLFTTDADRARAEALWGESRDSAILLPPVVSAQADERPAPRLLYHGEITRGCRLDDAVRALAADPELTMQVNGTGKGRYAMPVVRLSRHEGTEPRIRWESDSHADHTTVADSSTVVLVAEPDSARQQVVMASYMAQGAVILASDTPAARQLITDGRDGLLVSDFTTGAIREAARRAVAEPSIGHEAAAHAAEAFAPGSLERRLVEIYRSL